MDANMDAIKTKILSRLKLDFIIKYIIEGFAVAVAAFYIPRRTTQFNEVLTISLLSSLSFFILDVCSDEIGKQARLGAGIKIGMNMIS